jgi:hypothetical protein
MVNFVSIIKYSDGLASYRVSAAGRQYTAQLIRATGVTSVPERIQINTPVQNAADEKDPMVKQLIAVIQDLESSERY